jgi:hypothetical protein
MTDNQHYLQAPIQVTLDLPTCFEGAQADILLGSVSDAYTATFLVNLGSFLQQVG